MTAGIVPPPKHGAFNCPACGEANRWPDVRFCAGAPETRCLGQTGAIGPHLHRTCGRCRREDRIPVLDPVSSEGHAIICTTTHPVDDDDEGRSRSADVGMTGMASRNLEVEESASDAYVVIWSNGAWGFYNAEELNRVSAPRPRIEVSR